MASGSRNTRVAALIILVVVLLGFSALQVAAGLVPWILLPFVVYLGVYVFAKVTRNDTLQRVLTTAPGRNPGRGVESAQQDGSAVDESSSDRVPAPEMPSLDAAPATSGRPTVDVNSLPPELAARVTGLKQAGQTVEAIAELRKATGMELYEASQLVRRL